MQDRFFTDEELVAYLDGEKDFTPYDEIAAALKTDIALAKRLEALRVDTNALEGAFDGLLAGVKAPPELPITSSSVAMPAFGYKRVAAAAVIALVAGLAGRYAISNSDQPDWMDYVAAYQALYTNSTLSHVQVEPAQLQSELARVSSAIGKDIDLASLMVSSEVEYKRAQILGYEGKALIQLAFLTSTGEPMALCIIQADGSQKTEIAVGEMENMSSAAWSKDGYEYLLIGGTDDGLVSRLAAEFSKNEV